jgi:hypothetical protein
MIIGRILDFCGASRPRVRINFPQPVNAMAFSEHRAGWGRGDARASVLAREG